MSAPPDDLAPLFQPPDREHAGRAQGIVVEWNQATFENVIEVHGTRFRNVALEQPPLGLSLVPGAVVMVERWRPRSERGSATYSISGQWLKPGEGRGEQAVAFLTSSLGKAIARAVFAEGILFASEPGSVSTASTSFVALSGGPEVPNVEISASGKAIVLTTAHINSAAQGSSESTHGGVMSFQVSGATSVSPSDFLAVSSGGAKSAATADPFDAAWNRSSSLTPLQGLNPGTHTFTARYRTRDNNTVQTTFFNRNITVIAF